MINVKKGFSVSVLAISAVMSAAVSLCSADMNELTAENLRMGSIFYRNDIFGGQTDPAKLQQNLRYCVLDGFGLNYLRGKQGDGPAMVAAMSHIECPDDIPSVDRDTYRLQIAEKLLRIMGMLRFNSVEIPANPSGDIVQFTLGKPENNFTFTFKRVPDVGWVAASSMLTSVDFQKAYDKAKNIQKLRASKEIAYCNGMESPKFALRTFYCGVNEILGYSMDDAISVLNIPNINPELKSRIGRTLCVMLYRMLKYATDFELTAMSADPNHESPLVLLTNMSGGLITMADVVDAETGKHAWKIDIDSIGTLNEMYVGYMKEGMDKKLGNFPITSPPIHIQLDDFFWKNASNWERSFFGLNIWKWPVIALMLILSLLIMPFIRYVVRGFCWFLQHTNGPTEANKLGSHFILPLQITALAFLWLQGLVVITASPGMSELAMFVLEVILSITLTWLAWLVVDEITIWIKTRINTTRQIAMDMLGYFFKLIILIFLILQICNLFKLDGTKFFAALGIGGLAVAMAGKEAIANLIGTLLIMVDRPFHIHDLIQIGDTKGTVERVGLRSTLIRTYDDSCMMIPNAKFTDMDVENLSKRKWRYYKTSLGVLYSTPVDTLQKFVAGLQQLVKDSPNTLKDESRCFINVSDLGDSAILIVANLYFRNNGRHQEYKDREAFITSALKLAESMGVSYAFPSRTIYMADNDAAPIQPEEAGS